MNLHLKHAREKAGYSIEEVAGKLNIRKQYLIDIEEDNFSNIPGEIYIQGYTNMYYKFLGIDKKQDEIKTDNPPILANQENLSNKSQKYILPASIITLIAVIFIYNYFT